MPTHAPHTQSVWMRTVQLHVVVVGCWLLLLLWKSPSPCCSWPWPGVCVRWESLQCLTRAEQCPDDSHRNKTAVAQEGAHIQTNHPLPREYPLLHDVPTSSGGAHPYTQDKTVNPVKPGLLRVAVGVVVVAVGVGGVAVISRSRAGWSPWQPETAGAEVPSSTAARRVARLLGS